MSLAWPQPARALPPEGRAPRPSVSIPLESLGFYGVSRPFLEAGSSMLTVHFLDSQHLLVTHSLRALVPRRKEATTENEDGRLVGADIVALPSGKVVAHTVWHTHDHARYLWPLGRGRFLVRIGRELSIIAPLARLETKDPFEALQFPTRGGFPAAVLVSPDSNLLTVETEVHEKKPTRWVLGPTAEDREEERRSREVIVDFFRLSGDGSEASPLRVASAGAVRAAQPIALPLDGDGYLWIGASRRGAWPIAFHEFGGKAENIAPVLSSCAPHLQLVSRSQFLAFACQGSDDRVKLEAYGFDGHENWEESLSLSPAPSSFAFAPEAGRFAMSRVVEGFTPVTANNASGSYSLQELRVYQTESGDLLLKLQSAPAHKVAKNFDLSSDGHLFAVARGAQLEVYELPKASSRDLKDLAEAREFTPPLGAGPVRLGQFSKAEEKAEEAGEAEPTTAKAETRSAEIAPDTAAATGHTKASAAADSTGQPSNSITGASPASADTKPTSAKTTDTSAAEGAGSGERRRPPTLLNPGEKAESGSKKNAPQL